MQLIPAIDLRHGQVVRLYQGKYDQEKQYELPPVQVAESFAEAGAQIIHLVDLDGAREGTPVHKELILGLAQKVHCKFELGGGIRNLETIQEYLEEGISRIILGTIAHSDPELVEEALAKFPKKIVIGIDAHKGKVAVSGWEQKTTIDAIDLAKKYNRWEVRAIIYTDIDRDGTLEGPAVEGTKKILEGIEVPVIASGGVANMTDLEKLKPLEKLGLEGVIVGKAIYENQIDLKKAIKSLASNTP
jgi:phosphoribosylformimino-5-aminoimidazole carboxamide ribotide isomerase